MGEKTTIEVPKRWVAEVMLALRSATVIGERSCNPGDHLNYANHDRLIREVEELVLNDPSTQSEPDL